VRKSFVTLVSSTLRRRWLAQRDALSLEIRRLIHADMLLRQATNLQRGIDAQRRAPFASARRTGPS
jgi:hypothetical protein